jgi:O-antigen ligase
VTGRRGGIDATAILTAYLALLWFIPSPMVVQALGSAGSPANMLGVAIFMAWAWFTVRRSEPTGTGVQPVRAALLALLVVMLVVYAHAMAGPLPGDEISVADSGLLRLLGMAGVALMAADGIVSLDRHVVLLRRLAFAAGVVALLGLLQYATSQLYIDRIRIPGLVAGTSEWTLGSRSGFTRPSGTSTSPIEYGVVLGMTLPILIVCASVRSRYRWLYRAMLVAMMASIYFSLSRSAYLCAVAGVLVLALKWDNRRRLTAVGFVAVVTAVMYVSVPGLLGSIQGLFSNADEDPSIASRTGSYDIAGQFISSSPIIGRGFGTFLPKYWILDNAYLGLMIEAGAVGLLAFLTLVVCALVSARQARVDLEGRTDDPSAADHALYAHAILASVAAGACGLAFFDAFAFPQTAGCFLLLIGLAGAARRLTRETQPGGISPRASRSARSAPGTASAAATPAPGRAAPRGRPARGGAPAAPAAVPRATADRSGA